MGDPKMPAIPATPFSMERIRETIQYMTDRNLILIELHSKGMPTRWLCADTQNRVVMELTVTYGEAVHQICEIEARWITQRK